MQWMADSQLALQATEELELVQAQIADIDLIRFEAVERAQAAMEKVVPNLRRGWIIHQRWLCVQAASTRERKWHEEEEARRQKILGWVGTI